VHLKDLLLKIFKENYQQMKEKNVNNDKKLRLKFKGILFKYLLFFFIFILIRAYREHLQRRFNIENRRPSASQRLEQERHHRRIISAKRAKFVEQKLIQQTKFNLDFILVLF